MMNVRENLLKQLKLVQERAKSKANARRVRSAQYAKRHFHQTPASAK